MVFKKGNVPWDKGIHLTEIHRQRIAKNNANIWKGKKLPRAMVQKAIDTKKRLFAEGKITPWNKGKTGVYSAMTRKKLSEARKGKPSSFKGKHHSKEAKRKLSESRKRGIVSGKIITWNKGKKGIHLSPNTEFKKGSIPWIKGKKGVFVSPRKGKKGTFSQEAIEKMRNSSIMRKRNFPHAYTSIELKLANELSNRSFSFYMQKPIRGITSPDISFPERKIAIFADGDYWHNLPNSRAKDPIINQKLKEKGWIVLRFWEHDIKKDVKKCVDQIEKAL